MYLGYVYRIYVWICDFYVLFLVISIFEFVIYVFGFMILKEKNEKSKNKLLQIYVKFEI